MQNPWGLKEEELKWRLMEYNYANRKLCKKRVLAAFAHSPLSRPSFPICKGEQIKTNFTSECVSFFGTCVYIYL